MTTKLLTGTYPWGYALGAPITNQAWGTINGGNDAVGEWNGDSGLSTDLGAIPFQASGNFENAASAAGVDKIKSPKLTTLVKFMGSDGATPSGSLIADAAGDLFGTTAGGGADHYGTVFEIAKTQDGYARKPTTLVSFTGTDGGYPYGSLIADAAGDLFGTASYGGADDDGTVFEIAKTKHGYATTPTTLVSFTGGDGSEPLGSLIADAAGDLFGTTASGGADDDGTVFEIAKTQGGYATTPTTLVSFTGADGNSPIGGSLIADAAGDLFGTTASGGADDDGTVFEIAKTQGGYAGAPTTLVSFTGTDGSEPVSSLIADAAGDLFGTTNGGGADGYGTVFEIAKTQGGYASATTLVSFTVADGSDPRGSLIFDAAGDLFGTTAYGGTDDDGTVFEIVKTKHGYASAPTTLASFNFSDGETPSGSLTADAAGDLFGTTASGGPYEDGTVFEIAKTKGGYVLVQPALAATPAADIAVSLPGSAAFAQAMASHGASRFGSDSPQTLGLQHETRTLLARPQIA